MKEIIKNYKKYKKAYELMKLYIKQSELNFSFSYMLKMLILNKWILIYKSYDDLFKYQAFLVLIVDYNTKEETGVLLYKLLKLDIESGTYKFSNLLVELRNKVLRENLKHFTIRVNDNDPVDFKKLLIKEGYTNSDPLTLFLSKEYKKLEGNYFTKNISNG